MARSRTRRVVQTAMHSYIISRAAINRRRWRRVGRWEFPPRARVSNARGSTLQTDHDRRPPPPHRLMTTACKVRPAKQGDPGDPMSHVERANEAGEETRADPEAKRRARFRLNHSTAQIHPATLRGGIDGGVRER